MSASKLAAVEQRAAEEARGANDSKLQYCSVTGVQWLADGRNRRSKVARLAWVGRSSCSHKLDERSGSSIAGSRRVVEREKEGEVVRRRAIAKRLGDGEGITGTGSQKC